MSLIRAVTACAFVSLTLAACQPSDEAEQTNAEANEAQAKPPVLPVAEPPLDRKALLLAAASAASNYAAGLNPIASQRALDGKRIEIRLRFGCPGLSEAESSGPFSASFEEEDRTLRLRASPGVEREDAAVAPIVGDDVEAVEGFWVRRPWLLETACPAAPPKVKPAEGDEEETAENDKKRSAESVAVVDRAGGRIGIVQFFTSAEPRSRRRDSRAYQTTKTLKEGEVPSASGYNLVLSGRLRRLPDGRVIACSGPAVRQAPDCVVSVQLDRVWMERADTGALIAEWGAV